MNLFSIVILALALAMDAFAVSISSGIVIRDLKFRNALKISLAFGIFQALMPIIGFLAGISFRTYIVKIDHWIAFALLSFLGIKMIIEALKNDGENCSLNPLDNKVLLGLSIATSIDALAIGVSFAFLHVDIINSSLIIGGITLVTCFIGVYIGKFCGSVLEKKAELAGGIVLCAIGIKILIEHLST